MTIVKSLLANAVFSIASSSIILLKVNWLSVHIPLNDELWFLMGAGLLIFSLLLIFLACNQTWANKLIKHVIRADFAWIVVTLISAVYFNSVLTSLAWLIIMSVNLIVLALAIWQRNESRFDVQ